MHAETLYPDTRHALETLAKEKMVDGLYLAGGTATALRLGHRKSIDLDWFSSKPFSVDELLQKLIRVAPFDVAIKETKTLTGQWLSTRVEFFEYPYPLLETTETWNGVNIAGLQDIALMKLIAISDRGSKKDFIDLFEICKTALTLESLFSLLPKKFPGINFDPYHLLKSLVYFEDAERDPNPDLIKNILWKTVKEFFLDQARLIKL